MSVTLADRLRGSWRILVKEIAAFGLVGGVSFAVDLIVFNLLFHHGTGPVVAKVASTIVATTLAYVGNRYWSFSHRARTSLRREAVFFYSINAVTLVISLSLIALFAYPFGYKNDAFVMNVVNLITIAIGTVIRFDFYKRFVFLHPDKVASGQEDAEGHARTAA